MITSKMRPFREFAAEDLRKVRFVLTDIDDTMTTNGMLPAASLQAIESLSEAGVQVIPVTGRPAGWCDHIARMWAVAAVVGENGAFYFSYDRINKKMRSVYHKTAEERRRDGEKLEQLVQRVLAEVPGSALASDQPYRVADVAIDFCEDVDPLSDDAIDKIVEIMNSGGATTKISSIHVNTWFGEYDKLTTTRKCLQDLFQSDPETCNDAIIFTGDSPNDEPMFAYFNQSVGVANVRNFSLKEEPTWVTEGKSASGFVEVAEAILRARG